MSENKNDKLKNFSKDMRGDQVIQDSESGALISLYLSSAEKVLKELNKISRSMCLAKWYNVSINLTTGQTQSCYHPQASPIPAGELKVNPSALHNTEYKKIQRIKMLNGERPEECSYCWKIEDSGSGEHLSDRAYRSADLYTEELLLEAQKLGGEGNPIPRYVELSFSQKCNFKCSYCSPHLSSAWFDEVSTLGSYRINDYAHNDPRGLAGLGLMPSAEKTKKYVEAFWKWWPELYGELKHLKITGGEPLIDENTYKIFDYVIANPKKELQLMVMSNCNPSQEQWDRFLEKVKKMAAAEAMDHFMLFCSLDSWGEQAEYIRNGLSFEKLHKNISDFLEQTEKTSITIISTFNLLSVVGFKNFLKGILELRKKYSNDRQKVWIDFPVLQSPQWLSVKLLPKEYLEYIKECIAFVEGNLETAETRFKGFKDFELAKIKALYATMQEVVDQETTRRHREDFIKFFDLHDKRRNTSYRKTFPEMTQFFDVCENNEQASIIADISRVEDLERGEETFLNKSPASYQEYKKTILDPVSPSFCAAKWYNATIWLGAGITASCHHPKAHRIPLSELEKNYKAIHNTEYKKKQRKLMLEGARPPECEYCWKAEDAQNENVSDRVFKSIIYKEKDVSKLKNSDPNENIDLKTLEISFDRICNFACSYCNPGFSSSWVKDIKENGPYKKLGPDGIEHYESTNDWGQVYSANRENPYIDAFWKWWPELSKTLFELRVTGGEPLMSLQFWKLIDWFTENEGSNIRFAVNSNLGAESRLIEKLIKKSKDIKKFDLYTSCEATGKQAEYIRDGLCYDNWKNNLIKSIEDGNFRKVVIMMTVNSLSIFGITDFMDEMLEQKNKFGREHPVFSLSILRHPNFQSVAILPDHLKLYAKNRLQMWYDKNQNSLMLQKIELDSIKGVINHLDTTESGDKKNSKEILWKDFKNFYTQYDARRKKSFNSTFPIILTDWMDSI